MEDIERVRIMDRMREKVRERERGKIDREHKFMREDRRERDEIEKMGFVALNPLCQTIFCLQRTVRVVMDPRSRVFLTFAALAVDEAVQLLKSLEKFRGRVEDKFMNALEGEISEAAWKLENVLDSHVAYSKSETESIEFAGRRGIWMFFLNLERIEEDIDVFIQKVVKMEKLLNPWLLEEEGGGGEEEERGGGGGYVTRTLFISWFATKAASIFLGMKDHYILDLQKLLPDDEEEDDDYAVLFSMYKTVDFSIMVKKKRFTKINIDLMIWWLNKAGASIFVIEKEEEEGEYTRRLVKPLPESESVVNMVGSSELFCKIRGNLLEDFETLKVVSIVGMVGIGKTALAKRIIQDPLIRSKFECCIFQSLGPEFQWKETLRAILVQMPDGDKMLMEEDVDLAKSVLKTLTDRKCLIVLDDFWHQGRRNLFDIYPKGSSRGAILFTTRSDKAAGTFKIFLRKTICKVPFLDKEESWDLLRRKIFGEEKCLLHLEKAGKKIAENCEGLPLLILAVGDLLSQAEKTPEYWIKVAANKRNSIFVDAYEQVSGVVYPSYRYLDKHLKACFLYLGAFPQNDEVRVSRLINLWSTDGFLGVPYTLIQQRVDELLSDMVSNNVALGSQRNILGYKLKALSLHSVFWYVCKREARKEKFLHVLNSYTDASARGIKTQRRISIYNATILSLKDVRDSIASISALHSFLCTGPYHQYEVPTFLGELRFVKVVDALTIRFYEFPIEVVKLVHLRYLALTSNGNLPPSISNFWGLRCLILHQHQSIKSSSVSHSHLPVEIWDLLELEHLQITGRNLPDPPPDARLSKLVILLDVGAQTCTERVLESIPYIEKLRVQIELMPVVSGALRFCDDISHLGSLKSLQFIVVNPELKVEIVPLAAFISFSNLTKLTLCGFGYPWKDMHKIAELPNLEDLKLKCYAFRGEKWEVKDGEFERLGYLSIEDTGLVQWTGNFERLRALTIKNCYRLLQLPKLSTLSMIWVVDCNPSAVTCAKQMATDACSVYVDCSWLVR